MGWARLCRSLPSTEWDESSAIESTFAEKFPAFPHWGQQTSCFLPPNPPHLPHIFSNMPPRIPNAPSSLLLQSSACSGSSSRCTASRLPTWASSCSSSSPQPSQPTTHQQQCSSFSTTAPAHVQSVRRQKMFAWLDKKGSAYKEHTRQGPNLLGGQGKDGLAVPFPNNPYFKSQPVLSEGSREIIYQDVMENGLPIKAVSAKYNVDVRRVAAVIRLKEIEKRWIKEVSSLSFSSHCYDITPRPVSVPPDCPTGRRRRRPCFI